MKKQIFILSLFFTASVAFCSDIDPEMEKIVGEQIKTTIKAFQNCIKNNSSKDSFMECVDGVDKTFKEKMVDLDLDIDSIDLNNSPVLRKRLIEIEQFEQQAQKKYGPRN